MVVCVTVQVYSTCGHIYNVHEPYKGVYVPAVFHKLIL